MDEEYASSSSEAEAEPARQNWVFKKLWTTSLDSAISNTNLAREELVRKIIALAGVDRSILDELKNPAICFKPEKAKATIDETGRRVVIAGVIFKPGMEGFQGKRWKLIAENSLYSYLLPLMCCKFEEKLPNEQLYIVLNGDVDGSSHQIKLDQDYKKTVVIAVNRGPLSKVERAVHSVLSFNYKLSWSNSTKCRELTVEPLHPGVEDKLLYWNYMPSHNRYRPGTTTERIRKYLQKETAGLPENHRADGEEHGIPRGDSGSNESTVDAMETNHNEQQHQKSYPKDVEIGILSAVEENLTDHALHASGVVTTNTEKHSVKSSTRVASSFNEVRSVPVAERVETPRSPTSPSSPEQVTIKKRPGPRSKTVMMQPRKADYIAKSVPVEHGNTTRPVPKPRSKATAAEINDISPVESETDKGLTGKTYLLERPQATSSLETDLLKPAQANLDSHVSDSDETNATQKMNRPPFKNSEKLRKNVSVYGFDAPALEGTSEANKSSPESIVQRNTKKRLNLEDSDLYENSNVNSQTTSKGNVTNVTSGAADARAKHKTYTISVADKPRAEITVASREVSPSEELGTVSQESKSSSNTSVMSAVRGVATALDASENNQSSSTFTVLKSHISLKSIAHVPSSTVITEVPAAVPCVGPQLRANGINREGSTKVPNRKIGKQQDQESDEPQAKKMKASGIGESKYKYESLRKLSNKLEQDSNAALRKRNVYAVVEAVLQVGKADKQGYCRDIKTGTHIVRIRDNKKNGILARFCPMSFNSDHPTEQMKLGPCMKVGDVIRIHRATVQFELQYGENQMVISTSPHHNYALFDGSKDNEEMMGRRGLASNPTLLSDSDKETIKRLWVYWSSCTLSSDPEILTEELSTAEVPQEQRKHPLKAARGTDAVSNNASSNILTENNAASGPSPRRSPRKVASSPGRTHLFHEQNSQDVPESQATIIDPDPAANIRDSDFEEEPLIPNVQDVNGNVYNAEKHSSKVLAAAAVISTRERRLSVTSLLTSDEDTEQISFQRRKKEDISTKNRLHAGTKLPLGSSGSYVVKYGSILKEFSIMRLGDMDFDRDGLSYNLFGKIENFRVRIRGTTTTMFLEFTDKTYSDYDFLTFHEAERSNAETVQIEVLIEKHERELVQNFLTKSGLSALLLNVKRIPTLNVSKLQTTIANIVFTHRLP